MIEQVLRAVFPILEQLGIPYLLSGGIAATLHGRPRFTHDIDVVIDPTNDQLSQLRPTATPSTTPTAGH